MIKPYLRVEQIGPMDSRRTVWRLYERFPYAEMNTTKIAVFREQRISIQAHREKPEPEWFTVSQPILFTDIVSGMRWLSVRPTDEIRHRHIQEIIDHTRLLDNILVTVLLPQVQKEVDSWLGTDTLLSSEHGC